MKTKYFILAAAAALFAACSSDDGLAPEQQAATQAEQVPVVFDSYVNRATTRAGFQGALTTDQLKQAKAGFGVFGYYTDNTLYSQNSLPNFMYNEKVTYEGSAWTYSPVKYWPNEFGGEAISDGEDRLTFFAYAPYVDVYPGTGRINQETGYNTDQNSLTSGIVGMTSNVTTGDPYVKFYADLKPANRVDLCWGVAKDAWTVNDGVVAGIQKVLTAGDPFVDIIKPKIMTSKKIAFQFYHALASLNVQIDTDVDVVSHATSSLDDATKIYVRSVTFEGFTTKGLLNLNASSADGPLWYELNSTNTRLGSGVTTIYDGRRDGKEAQARAEATNETPRDLNPVIIQTDASTPEAGVTNTPVNLFNSETLTDKVYVIPTNENLKVTIVYDVETADPNAPGFLSDGKTHGISIENKITKEIGWGDTPSYAKIEAGKAYLIKLHLGMTSVQFDAAVEDWDASADEGKADLPINETP